MDRETRRNRTAHCSTAACARKIESRSFVHLLEKGTKFCGRCAEQGVQTVLGARAATCPVCHQGTWNAALTKPKYQVRQTAPAAATPDRKNTSYQYAVSRTAGGDSQQFSVQVTQTPTSGSVFSVLQTDDKPSGSTIETTGRQQISNIANKSKRGKYLSNNRSRHVRKHVEAQVRLDFKKQKHN